MEDVEGPDEVVFFHPPLFPSLSALFVQSRGDGCAAPHASRPRILTQPDLSVPFWQINYTN